MESGFRTTDYASFLCERRLLMIDSHQHFWKYSEIEYGWISPSMGVLKRDFLPQDLDKEIGPRGFEGCVAVQARSTMEETRWLLELAAKHPFIKAVVGWVDVLSPAVDSNLQFAISHLKFKGVRHIAQDEPDERFLMRPDFLRGVKAVLDAGLSYDLLIYPNQLPLALDFAEHFSGARIVLDHLAKPFIREKKTEPWATNIFELGSLPHVYCKVSGLVTEAAHLGWSPDDFKYYLDTVLDSFGPQRLMYGSDWPVCLLAASYGQVFDLAKTFSERLSPEEQKGFFGENAKKFYKIA